MSERNVLLGNVSHPFLVGLQYSFQSPSKLYFVLDYASGGENKLGLYIHIYICVYVCVLYVGGGLSLHKSVISNDKRRRLNKYVKVIKKN